MIIPAIAITRDFLGFTEEKSGGVFHNIPSASEEQDGGDLFMSWERKREKMCYNWSDLSLKLMESNNSIVIQIRI